MKNEIFVSIITPTYNRTKYIKETVESVVNQTYQKWELIIIDDGSTIENFHFINSLSNLDSRITIYSRNEYTSKKGASVCRNIGIKKARGEYVIFLDSDDILDENCLLNRVNYTINLPEAEAILFQTINFTDIQNNIKDRLLLPKKNERSYLRSFLRHHLPFSITNVFWKKEILISLKGFNEDFKRFQDVELHIRTLLNGTLFHTCEDENPDAYRRLEKNNTPHNNVKNVLFSVNLLFKLFENCPDEELWKDIEIGYNVILYNYIIEFYRSDKLNFNKYIEYGRKHNLIKENEINFLMKLMLLKKIKVFRILFYLILKKYKKKYNDKKIKESV